ncbi:hypothetical protein PENSPDRAFT_672621, partial [Peniophora sp. CONT]
MEPAGVLGSEIRIHKCNGMEDHTCNCPERCAARNYPGTQVRDEPAPTSPFTLCSLLPDGHLPWSPSSHRFVLTAARVLLLNHGKKLLKRPSETSAVNDRPNKKKPTDVNNKLGCPRNLGDEQFSNIMSGLPDYLAEKCKKLNKERHNIGKVLTTKHSTSSPMRAATQAEAEEAAEAVAKGPENMEAERFVEKKSKDEVVAAVCNKITKLYQKVVREGEPSTPKPVLDIPKLIKAIMSKPTQRQLYIIWASFMEGSEEFLHAMMQFFVNHVSGIAVIFLAGPQEVSLSETVCKVPGKPKVLYSQIAEEEMTLRLMGNRILSQSRLMNELKWRIQLHNEDSETQGDTVITPMDEDSCLDSALRQPQQTTLDAEATGDIVSAVATAETQSTATAPSTNEKSTASQSVQPLEQAIAQPTTRMSLQ